MKYILALIALIFLMGCQGNTYLADNNIPELTTTLDTRDWSEFSSEELGIKLHYPENWVIHGDEIFIRIAEKENHFPWKDYASVHPDYSIWTQQPYLSHKLRLLDSMSATQVAKVTKNISQNYSTEIIEPIIQVDINGHDGATVLDNNAICYRYDVFLSLDKDDTVVLTSCGPEETVEEMKSVLNTIALSIEPLSN